MVTIYKQKGDIMDCGSYIGIKMLEHVWTIFERVFDTRLRKIVQIHEIQYGFTPGKSTIDATFIVRQLLEISLEGNRKLYCCFVDLKQTYDRVPQEIIY